MELAKRIVRRAFRTVGYEITRINERKFPPDFDAGTKEVCEFVRPFTMTSPERVFALRHSVLYLLQRGIPGDFVECGVWRGGSMMAVARTMRDFGVTDRNLYLFDTFEGMSAPTQDDVNFNGESASDLLAQSPREMNPTAAFSALDEVKSNLKLTGYPPERLFFIEGKVEETIPAQAPAQVALLRLDTDWYGSTYHELLHLYPRLSPGGILIIDDYGHWEGARKAVDTYFAEHSLKLLLHRIDYTGRICVKIE
jgi:hypothetical protein